MTVDVARSVKKMFVDGRWIDSESGKHFDATSPATGEQMADLKTIVIEIEGAP